MTPEKVIEELETEIHLFKYVDGLYAENIIRVTSTKEINLNGGI